MADKNAIVYDDERMCWALTPQEGPSTKLLRVDAATLQRWRRTERAFEQMQGEIATLVGEQQLAELKAKGFID